MWIPVFLAGLSVILFIITGICRSWVIRKWNIQVKWFGFLSLTDVSFVLDARGLAVSSTAIERKLVIKVSRVGIKLRIPNWKNPAIVSFFVTRPTIDLDLRFRSQDDPMSTRPFRSSPPSNISKKKMLNPFTSFVTTPKFLFILSLLRRKVVRFIVKRLLFFETTDFSANVIFEDGKKIRLVLPNFRILLTQDILGVHTSSIRQSEGNGFELSKNPSNSGNLCVNFVFAPCDVLLLEDFDGKITRIARTKSDTGLFFQFNLNGSDGRFSRPCILLELNDIHYILGPNRNTINTSLETKNPTQDQETPSEAFIIPLINQGLQLVHEMIKDVFYIDPKIVISLNNTCIECHSGNDSRIELSLAKALLLCHIVNPNQKKLVQSWQGDTLMEWEHTDSIIDINLEATDLALVGVISSESPQRLFNLPNIELQMNIQVVDTLDPGVDPSLQSNEEPRMGIHVATHCDIREPSVTLLDESERLLLDFRHLSKKTDNQTPATPKSLLSRQQHQFLSILSKSFLAFSFELNIESPCVALKFSEVKLKSMIGFTEAILRCGLGAVKLSVWNVFGGIPDGASFPLKFDVRSKYLFFHCERPNSDGEKQTEDVIEEPEWFIACQGDLVVGRSIIVSSNASELFYTERMHLNQSNMGMPGGMHRVTLGMVACIFIGEASVNLSRFSYSFIDLDYFDLFSKLGLLFRRLKSPDISNHVDAPDEQAQEGAVNVLPLDFNLNISIDMSKFLVGISGEDGMNGISFSTEKVSVRMRADIECVPTNGFPTTFRVETPNSASWSPLNEGNSPIASAQPSMKHSKSFRFLPSRSSGIIETVSETVTRLGSMIEDIPPNTENAATVSLSTRTTLKLEFLATGISLETIIESVEKSPVTSTPIPLDSPMIQEIFQVSSIDFTINNFPESEDITRASSSSRRDSNYSSHVDINSRSRHNSPTAVSNHKKANVMDVRIRDLRAFFSMTALKVSLLAVLQLKKILDCCTMPLAAENTRKVYQPQRKKRRLQLFINRIEYNFKLPFDVDLRMLFKQVRVNLGSEHSDLPNEDVIHVEGEAMSVLVPVKRKPLYPVKYDDSENGDYGLDDIKADMQWETLVSVQFPRLHVCKRATFYNNKEASQNTIQLSATSFLFVVPHSFEVSNIIEAVVAVKKSSRILMNRLFAIPLPTPPSTGSTCVVPEKIPIIKLEVALLVFKLLDDPFEICLSRNWKMGRDEQIGRIARDKAFQKKVQMLRNANHRSGAGFLHESSLALGESSSSFKTMHNASEADVEAAWWLLQDYNSQNWISRIKKSTLGAKDDPALLSATFHSLSVNISPPCLPAETVEQSLHLLDPDGTPAEKQYDDLIPRALSISFDGASVRLRDYSYPLLFIPKSLGMDSTQKFKSWRSEGLIVIAEQLPTEASKRQITVSLEPLPYIPIIYFKTINPVKLYTNMEIMVHVPKDESARISWGASIDPAINDVSRVIDSFTKPNIDPSPTLGWWDKMRILLHGQTVIKIGGDGDFRFCILGSNNPYRRRLTSLSSSNAARVDSVNSEGIEIVFAKGTQINLGRPLNHNIRDLHKRIPEIITIETGLLMFSSPKSADLGELIDIKSDSNSKEPHYRTMDTVIAKLVGGVIVSFGVQFIANAAELEENESGADEKAIYIGWPTRTHCDISLSTPDFLSSQEVSDIRKSIKSRQPYDAFRGFRTNTMHLDINIVSPRPYYSSLTYPMNFLNMSSSSYNIMRTMSNLYQSPLMNVPIHRGRLFTYGEIPKKPKLSRAMGSAHLKVNMLPLVLGLFEELEDDNNSGVGVRCRAEKMDVNMKFVQKTVRLQTNKVNYDDSLEIQHIGTKWRLQASEVGFSELEGRALSFGKAYSILREKTSSIASELADSSHPLDNNFDDNSVEDLQDWIIDEDYLYMEDLSEMKLIPFIWSPKITYSKRRDDTQISLEKSLRSETAVYNVQATLYKRRLHEINALMRHYLEVEKSLTYRATVFFDDTQKRLCDILREKLESLHEKKLVIEKYIKKCERPKKAKYLAQRKHSMAQPQSFAPKSSFFDYFYIIHNVNLLWKKDARNILFKYFELQSKDLAVKYYLTNAANRIVKDLISSLADNNDLRKPVSEDPVSDTLDDSKKTPTIGAFDDVMANRLLSSLINERERNFYIPNECDISEDFVETKQLYGNDLFMIQNRAYLPSKDALSPDYVPQGYGVDSDYLILLVKPQVNLEADIDGDLTKLQTVVVAAEEMEFQSIKIVDLSPSNSVFSDQDDEGNVAKTRQVLNIRNAQFFVARKEDVDKTFENDLESLIQQQLTAWNDAQSKVQQSWPLWVPTECLINYDHYLNAGHLERVMEKTEASFIRDKANPIYVASNGNMNDRSHVMHVNFPIFEITVNSMQYYVFFNVIVNLLVYRDPARGERNERLKKMTLALEQMENIHNAIDSVSSLQEKIKQTESLLAYQVHSESQMLSKTAVSTQLNEVRLVSIRYKDELYVLMEALKQMLSLSRNKKSVDIAWQLQVQTSKLVWTMTMDDGEPLCKWIFDRSVYEYIHNEDQSSANTLEIDRLYVENVLPSPQLYKDLITAYVADKRAVDFKKQKMLRVYWREMAPVAGIQVVDHFEINMFPLQFQMTYDIGKLLVYYIFPEKKKKHDVNKVDVRSSSENRESVSTRKTRRDVAQTSATNTVPDNDALLQMQSRASRNKSFIYIKVPGMPLCLSYRGSKEKNFEDLNMFVFRMPTLEYRNKTWSWLDFLDQVKKDAIRAALANTASLVKEKIFSAKREDGTERPSSIPQQALPASAIVGLNVMSQSYALKTSKSFETNTRTGGSITGEASSGKKHGKFSKIFQHRKRQESTSKPPDTVKKDFIAEELDMDSITEYPIESLSDSQSP